MLLRMTHQWCCISQQGEQVGGGGLGVKEGLMGFLWG